MQPQRSGSQQPIGRTRRRRLCARDGCDALYEVPEPWPHPWPRPFCSPECHRLDKPTPARKATTPLRHSATQAKRKPVSVASAAQRAKRIAGASIVSGATEGLHAAHLCPRDLGGCEHGDCTVPLTAAEHRAFDDGLLDLLPHLVPHHTVEIAHALGHYRGDLIALLERLTGCRWVPADEHRRAAA